MAAHRLEPLLRPRSVAVLGATEREGTVGRTVVENLLKGGFEGRLFAVNPRYESVCGVPCFASLSALPEPVEHVIFAVSDARIEAALDEVIAHGARAATMMSSLVLAEDRHPPLRERVLAKIRAAGLVVCGANGMGFYNFADGIWGCGFLTREHVRGGNVSYISHSGSGMCGIVDTDERIDFNLVVSTGQELAVTMDEYLDFALGAPAMLLEPVDGRYLPFSEHWASGEATLHDWQEHLTTLFPDVRPRGYLEVRCLDAVPMGWYAAPIVLLAGLLYDRESLHTANDLLGSPDPALLSRAGSVGLADPFIGQTARELFAIGLIGAVSLVPSFIDPHDLEVAEDFARRFTACGHAPADFTP